MNYPKIVFDVETTGLDHLTHTMVSLGATSVKMVGERPAITDSFYSLVKPHPMYLKDGYADEALEINRITHKMLATAPEPEKVAERFRTWLKAIKPERMTSYNLDFDKSFLGDFIDYNQLGIKWDECLMRKFARVQRMSRWVPLDIARKHYSIELDGGNKLHNAKTDAIVAAQIMIKMEMEGDR